MVQVPRIGTSKFPGSPNSSLIPATAVIGITSVLKGPGHAPLRPWQRCGRRRGAGSNAAYSGKTTDVKSGLLPVQVAPM